jgi:tetratricopeptide (TPR) repeat protein
MIPSINRNKVIAFIFNTLSPDESTAVIDAIISNKDMEKIYDEEKSKIFTHRYIDNEFSPYECIEFGNMLKKDKQLSKEIKLHNEIDLFLKCNALEETLKEIGESLYEKKLSIDFLNNEIKPFPFKIRKLKKWLAAASVVFILASAGGATYHFKTDDTLENRLYSTYYEPFNKNDKYVLNSSVLSLAQQKYLKGEYINAMFLFQELPGSITIEAEKYLYIGLSLMELEQYEDAIKNFENVCQSLNSKEYIPQTMWYKGLCYLKIGDREKAISIFTKISKYNKGKYKEAKKILKKLS